MKAQKRKKSHTISTQTDPIVNCLYPRIILHRISLPKNNFRTVKKSNIMDPSLTVKQPDLIEKVPYSYRLFAKPITNNAKANSTLGENECNEENSLPPGPIKRRTSQTKKVTFKPGPLCSKKGLLEHEDLINDDDMSVPIMLNEPPCDDDDTRGSLEVITEVPEEMSSTSAHGINPVTNSIELQDEHDIEPPTDNGLNIAYPNIEIEQSTGYPRDSMQVEDLSIPIEISVIDQNNTGNSQSKCNNGEPETYPNASHTNHHSETLNLHFEGVTTIISHKNYQRGQDGNRNSPQENDCKEDSVYFEATKFMKIVANTVNIHNHFYKK